MPVCGEGGERERKKGQQRVRKLSGVVSVAGGGGQTKIGFSKFPLPLLAVPPNLKEEGVVNRKRSLEKKTPPPHVVSLPM